MTCMSPPRELAFLVGIYLGHCWAQRCKCRYLVPSEGGRIIGCLSVASKQLLRFARLSGLEFPAPDRFPIVGNMAKIRLLSGPLLGGMIMQHLNWRWIFWILTIICTINVSMGFIFLEETYKPVLLARRKIELEKLKGGTYYFEGEDDRPLNTKLYFSIQRPVRILFTQPIVFTMATYQALCFAITYSLYTQMEKIYGDGYGFDTLQVGMTYLGPGFGFLVAVLFLVPRIDTVFNTLTRRHNGMEKPEYRLPLANVGSVLIPISLFWFAWTVEIHAHWFVTILSTFFYGLGQIAIFNCTQNYYIDAFENYAASAIAAGALFRSIVGGIVPLFTTSLFEKMGVGWGMSIFGFLSVALAPSPLFFYHYGERLRERFAIQL